MVCVVYCCDGEEWVALACLVCMLLFFSDKATTEIYSYLHTPSLHDSLPIFPALKRRIECRAHPMHVVRMDQRFEDLAGHDQIGGQAADMAAAFGDQIGRAHV